MPRYPIGIQNFATLREDGFIYVDKTSYIHRLRSQGKYFFLSRPRRFGKSLFMSTLESYFRGQRKLFDGLAISAYENVWTEYPVFHLSLNKPVITRRLDLEDRLNSFLRDLEAAYGTDESSRNTALRFGAVIRKAYETTGRRVVILIDEYDKPLLDTVDNPELQEEIRSVLKGMYSNLKDMDAYIEFAMLTGVTKMGKLSIFSDLNNLNDISLDDEYSCICGITREELAGYFDEGIRQLAARHDMDIEETLGMLRKKYDGYHFAPDSPDIYNPFSILNCLQKCKFGDYWFETGTPTFLIKMIKNEQLTLRDLNDYPSDLQEISSVSFTLGNLIPVLYQSGYLTIKSYNRRFDSVVLGYPDQEVEKGFLSQLMLLYTEKGGKSEFNVQKFVEDLERGDVDSFMRRLQSLFAGYHYDQMELGNLELHYRNVIYLAMRLMGYYTQAEMQTANGRIDLLVQTPHYVYLFEFKLDSTPRKALAQINARGYSIPFRADGRILFKIGANFSSGIRGIDGWIAEKEEPAQM